MGRFDLLMEEYLTNCDDLKLQDLLFSSDVEVPYYGKGTAVVCGAEYEEAGRHTGNCDKAAESVPGEEGGANIRNKCSVLLFLAR